MIGYHEALQDNTRRLYTHSDNPDLRNSPKTPCALSESRRSRKSADHQHGPWRWQDLPSAQLRWRALAFRTQQRILKALRRYGVLRGELFILHFKCIFCQKTSGRHQTRSWLVGSLFSTRIRLENGETCKRLQLLACW